MRLDKLIVEEMRELFFQLADENNIDHSIFPPLKLEQPPDRSMGDWAVNYPMKVAKFFKQNPKLLAQNIVSRFTNDYVERCEIAGNGFINIRLKKKWAGEVLRSLLINKDKFGECIAPSKKKVLVEYVSANPTGPLHVGHGRGAAYGSSLVNLLKAAGYDVHSEHYLNDCGNQIDNLAMSVNARYLQILGFEAEVPIDGYYGEDIALLAQEIVEIYGNKFVDYKLADRLEEFKKIAVTQKIFNLKKDLEKFNVVFDCWYSESSLHNRNKVIGTCEKLNAKKMTYEQNAATWLKTTIYDDDKDRVLIRESGVPTYFASDLAYHCDKIERGYEKLVNIWGADHHGYIMRMFAGMTALTGNKDVLEIILLQMVHLYRSGDLVKISKRTGQLITLNELIEEVGCDAARYFFVMRSPDSQLDFDIDLAVSRSNDNPVYYVQYAHARIASINRTLLDNNFELPPAEDVDFSVLTSFSEQELVKKAMSFDDEIAWAAEERAPHKIANYIYELASIFHSFYNQNRIIGSSDELLFARWHLVLFVGLVIKKGLGVLGVSAPEKM